MDYMAPNDHASWSFGLIQKPPIGSRLNTKQGDHDTPNAQNRWVIIFYHVRGPA